MRAHDVPLTGGATLTSRTFSPKTKCAPSFSRTGEKAEGRNPQTGIEMSVYEWKSEYRIGLIAATLFGACVGAILGLRPIDPHLKQNLYWLWLGVWIVSGSALGATGGVIARWLRGK